MTVDPQPGLWQRIFGLDLRSLAAFRIVVGCLLLIDLWMRAQSLLAMYTDAGVMPLAMWADFLDQLSGRSGALSWSLHALSGSWQWQVILFSVAAVAYSMLAVGYRTRIATIVSWVLLTSVQVRNPIILTSGDSLLKVALFWSMFLPLGAVWSLDARSRRATVPRRVSGGEHTSPATAGLILLLFSLYFFAGIAKLNNIWISGDAMEYVSRLDIYSTSIGKWLRDYPAIMRVITWSTLVAEVVFPFLLLVPWRNRQLRVLLMVVFCGLHIGIALTMQIGLFQYVSMAIWVALLPGSFWDWLGRRFQVFARPQTVPQVASAAGWPARLAWGVSLFFVFYFLLWNISSITQVPACRYAMPGPLRVVGRYLNLRHEFRMFDYPPAYSPWFVYDAKLVDGSHFDIFRNQPVSYERPDSVLGTVPGHHWRRWHRNLVRGNDAFVPFRQRTAEYVMEQWNASHGKHEQASSLKLTVFLDEIEPRQSAPAGQIVLVWSHLGQDVANRDLFNDLLKQMNQKGEILP